MLRKYRLRLAFRVLTAAVTVWVLLSWTLMTAALGLAAAVTAVWETLWRRHPERFWEGSNLALRCARCTDRLCGR